MKYSRLFLLSLACVIPFMTLFVSGLSIYFGNRNEIAFTIRDVILPLTGLFLILSLLIYLLLSYIRRFPVGLKMTAGIIAGVSLGVWVQSQLFLWNFGQFNGQGILWGAWRNKMVLEGFTWTLIVAVVIIIFYKSKPKFVQALVLSIYLLGGISLVISALNAPPKIAVQADESTYKDIFSFHPKKNVLILLLDDFQSDYFNYIVNNYPDEVSELDGFTYYRNTISRFPTTKTSLPSIITGAVYKNDMRYDDYVKGSYHRFNMIQAYRNKSYSTWIVGQLQNLYPEVLSMESIAYKMNDNFLYPFFEYLDYGIFRALPTFIKPLIFDNGNWFFTGSYRKKYPPGSLGSDIQFLELIEKNAGIRETRKGTFKFFHFFIPHAPLRVNEDLQYDPGLKDESGYIRQARGAIKLASRIIKKLKQLGIYDQTEIIILSDHGTGNVEALNHKGVYFDALSYVPSYVYSSSLALLLHKPADSRSKLKVSDIPLELTDLACLLNLPCNDTIRRKVDLARAGGKRDRTFYYYEWFQEYWNNDFMPPMTEYIVTGPADHPESYSLGRSIYTSKGIETIPARGSPDYILGKEINFTAKGKGEADPYVRAGWSPAEEYQRWSDGPFAGLSFELNEVPQNDLILRLLGFGYTADKKINCQVVTLIANQVPIGRWLVNEGKWYEAIIPKKAISGKTLNVVFKISNPMSPNETGTSGDIRKLGMGVVRLVISQVK